jgi:uncharacterized protein (TIGR04222 family)
MFNPFDLAGPDFLLFYLLLVFCVVAAVALSRRAAEAGDPAPVSLSDPYQIAFLRGGTLEVARLATVSLLDRGFLHLHGTSLAADEKKPGSALKVPIEQQVLGIFASAAEPTSLFSTASKALFATETEKYESQLTRLKLLPDEEVRAARRVRLVMALAVLVGVALLKILIAIERGHRNIGFLIFLVFISVILCVKVSSPRLTARGKATLEGLRGLFGSLKQRGSKLKPGGNPNELLLLGAVFGAAALPAALAPHAKALFPRAASASGSGMDCGSSCGSSSSCGGGGDGGGSSCGGGGGCGGCGG